MNDPQEKDARLEAWKAAIALGDAEIERGETIVYDAAALQSITDDALTELDGKGRASAEELLAIGERCAAGLQADAAPNAGLLYDEHGLPLK